MRVLVTGGGSGIGLAVVEGIVARGGRAVIVGRRKERLELVAHAHGDRVIALPCDLEDPKAREGVVGRARAALGGLDGVVYSAGAVRHQLPGEIDDGSLRMQLEVNLVAPMRIAEEALPLLEPGGGIVFVGSTLAQRPVATSAVYSATKAGLLAMAKALAVTAAKRQIRVNSVVPGVVDTEMIRDVAERAGDLEGHLEHLTGLHPLGRLGTPRDVADAVLHLLTAPWTTGAELVVDGGLLLRE